MKTLKKFCVYPAIDLRAGKVVRLKQGNPEEQSTYGNDPCWWAERWLSEGAEWLHIINLDGAFGEDSFLNIKALHSLLRVGLKVEYGGGIRAKESINTILDMGAHRVFLGTAAIMNPDLVIWAITTYGSERIGGDIAAKDNKVSIKGWQEASSYNVEEAGKLFRSLGLERCVFTNVEHDGLANGIDLSSAEKLQNISGLSIVASGGVRCVEDVTHAQQAGLAGVIIGRALYEGKISLAECIKATTKTISVNSPLDNRTT